MSDHKSIPKWALSFLRFYCKNDLLEQIEGDLFELYDREPDPKKARRIFTWNVIRFCRWRYIKGLEDFKLYRLAMIKNYLKIAFRTLIRQKSYAGINIVGLAIGLASCLLITMYIVNEYSYDRSIKNVDRIYRVANGVSGRWTPMPLASTLTNEYPQIEASTRIRGLYESLIKYGDKKLVQKGGAWADSSVFQVFEAEFLEGSPAHALSAPDYIVLTQSLAKKLFPDQSAMNERIEVDGVNFQVSAIVKDPVKPTHFPYTFIGASLLDESYGYNWTGNNFWTYAKVRSGVTKDEIDHYLRAVYEKYVGPAVIAYTGHDSFEELSAEYPDRKFAFTAIPIEKIHLHYSHMSMDQPGSYRNVVIFTIIALFILLIACINYVNMATARSSLRSKEVGIRKAMGSVKSILIWQFLVESLVITFLAVLIAVVIAATSISFFNQLTGRAFSIADLFSMPSILAVFGLLLTVGLLAGTYPAYVISSFSPVRALRGQLGKPGKSSLRSGLMAFQFAISIFLVAVTLIIFRQVKYMQQQDLGISIDEVLVLQNGMELGDNYDVFRNQLKQLPEVTEVGKASQLPFHGLPDYTYRYGDKQSISPYNTFMSPEMFDVLGLELESGRLFQNNRAMDTASVVINEAMAKSLGFDDPIGQKVSRGDGLDFTIIGVIKDFNFTSLRRNIEPLIIRYGAPTMEIGAYHQSFIAIRLNTSDIQSSMDRIDKYWSKHVADYPLDATFLSDSFQRHFDSELKFGKVFTTFSVLAIFIAFLGLFSLTTFVLQRKHKEIAVRKVLGSTVSSILRMILKEFAVLVLIGGVIGGSAAFYWLNDWLNDYSYRIAVSWYLLIIPILLIMILTMIVVVLKSYKVAVSNPALALKEE